MTCCWLFDGLAIGLARVGSDGRLLDVNRHFCDLLGYARSELLAVSVDALEHKGDGTADGARPARLLAGEIASYVAEKRLRRKDGRLLWVRQTWCRPAGGVDSVRILACESIQSERRRMQKLRHQRDLALKRDADRMRLLATVSHDLRQPLQSIALFLDVLTGGAPERQRLAAVARLRGCLSDISGLVDSLIDFAKLEAGKITASVDEVNLYEIMDLLAACYAPLAASKGLIWGMLPACRIVKVRSDPVLLVRIMRNLLENAIRYTESGTVSLCCVAGERGLLHLQVIDSGPGIPADQIPQIFDEFHQLPTAGPPHRPGMGLGLAIVARLSSLLGHPLKVASNPGRGSQFSIVLPLTG